MADKVTQTDELQIELLNAAGDARRVIRVIDPRDGLTRTEVTEALAPAISWQTKSGGVTPFFYDDNDPSIGLTEVGTIERVRTMKTVTTIA